MGDRKLYSDEAAAYTGVKLATWRRYNSVANGRARQAPPADGTDIEQGHARPWWWQSTLDAYTASRRGRGRRRSAVMNPEEAHA